MGDIPFEVEVGEKPGPGKGGGESPDSPPPGGGKEAERAWSVTRLTRRIRGLLEEALSHVFVEGELSNLKRAASGHLYFNLKDEHSQIRCVMFRNVAQSLRFNPEDGLQVLLRGKVTVYEVRGEYQLQVHLMEPKGAGALQLAFEQLKRKLEAEGLFDPAAKKPLPFLPRRIGIVTSPRGAAIRDILHVLERRFPTMPVLIHPATVQGGKAAGEIAVAIATLNRLAKKLRIDLIIVGRGGGSVEDLWAFNEEAVARAIHTSAVPIISAVGHEVDFTIADFVADMRAPTPSAAAEIAVPIRAELIAMVEGLRERLFHRVGEGLELSRERWSAMRARLGSPEDKVRQLMQRTDELRERAALAAGRSVAEGGERFGHTKAALRAARPDRFNKLHRREARGLERRLAPALRRHVQLLGERLSGQAGLLDSLSPLTVLKRGYGAVTKGDGALLRSVKGVTPGDPLTVRLHDGTIRAEAKEVTEGED